MGRIDTCIYSLRALREVIAEDRNLCGTAMRGRAYARHQLQRVADALESIEARKPTEDVTLRLSTWYAAFGVTEMQSEVPNAQALYALDCAKLCHTEAELTENRLLRSILIDLVSVLVAFAEWLDMFPPGGADEEV